MPVFKQGLATQSFLLQFWKSRYPSGWNIQSKRNLLRLMVVLENMSIWGNPKIWHFWGDKICLLISFQFQMLLMYCCLTPSTASPRPRSTWIPYQWGVFQVSTKFETAMIFTSGGPHHEHLFKLGVWYFCKECKYCHEKPSHSQKIKNLLPMFLNWNKFTHLKWDHIWDQTLPYEIRADEWYQCHNHKAILSSKEIKVGRK